MKTRLFTTLALAIAVNSAWSMDQDANDCFLIKNLEDLKTSGNSFMITAKNSTACYKLEADIALAGTTNNWTPIAGFAGSFDGQGHTISGFNYSTSANDAAFIGSTSGNAVIKNLTIAGSFKGKDNVAAFVGLAGGNSITFENCVNKATVSGASDVGGLVGYATVPVTVKNSGNEGGVTGTGNQIGGLIGQTTGDFDN